MTVFGGHTTNFVPTPTAEYFKDGTWHVLPMAFSNDIQSITEAYVGRKLVPDQTKNARYQFFGDNKTLTKVTLWPAVTEITDGYFKGCSALSTVWWYGNITTIEQYAFQGCTALPYFNTPKSVKTIGKNAFNTGSKITAIYCDAVTPPVCDDTTIFWNVDKKQSTLYVPEQSIDLYKQAYVWKDFFNIESGIDSPTANSSITDVYTLDGQRLMAPKKGLVIQRTSDGRTRKVTIK